MKKPVNTKKIKKYSIIIVSVILVGYFVFAFINSNINNSDMVATEIAQRYSYKEEISAEAFIVRNETLLKYDGGEVLYYTAKDGDIVAKGSDIALVFENEDDALNFNKYTEISEQIDVLESLNTSHTDVKVDYSAVDKQIDIDLIDIISAVKANSPSDIDKSARDLIYSINQKQIITGKVTNFDERIAKLKEEAEKYKNAGSSYIDTITLDNNMPGGYFVASADGYESTYDYSDVEKLTVDTFTTDVKSDKVDENTIGKIVDELNWYIVVKLSAKDALTLSHATESLTATFHNTICRDLPVSLVTINQQTKQSEAIAVFKCNYMNDAISHLRNETVQISVNSFDGIKINKDAIHYDYVINPITDEKKKVPGVYVTYGNKLEFKEISILHSEADFVIVDENPREGKLVSGDTIKFNDEVVVKGDNLYAGKSINKN